MTPETEQKLESSVSLPVIQFVDRTLDAERRLWKAEIEGLRTEIAARRDGEKKALIIAAEDVNRRLETMNQFRDQINRGRVDYLTKEMYTRENSSLQERIKELEVTKSGYRGSYTAVAAVGVILVQLATLIVMYMWGR